LAFEARSRRALRHPSAFDERWSESGKFPRGTQLPNKRWYWTDGEIEAHERGLVGGGAA